MPTLPITGTLFAGRPSRRRAATTVTVIAEVVVVVTAMSMAVLLSVFSVFSFWRITGGFGGRDERLGVGDCAACLGNVGHTAQITGVGHVAE